MVRFLFWLLVIAGNLGLAAWGLRQGPAIARAIKGLADMFAPEVDWPAWFVLGAIGFTVFHL